jgi:hypothetical protein
MKDSFRLKKKRLPGGKLTYLKKIGPKLKDFIDFLLKFFEG